MKYLATVNDNGNRMCVQEVGDSVLFMVGTKQISMTKDQLNEMIHKISIDVPKPVTKNKEI